MVARTDPTSAMSAKKTRKATAVQTTPRIAIASSTSGEGIVGGRWRSAKGA